jgi:hypothetical protein
VNHLFYRASFSPGLFFFSLPVTWIEFVKGYPSP